MHITRTFFDTIPVTMCASADPQHAAARGTVLFYHGFSADIEVNLKELQGLAQAGYLAVGVDNHGHGRRRLPDFEARFAHEARWESAFLELVRATAREVPHLLDLLADAGLLPHGIAGIAGISMGGIIGYEAVALEPRLAAAAAIVATPKWLDAAARRKVYPCAVLSQTAGRDEVIDPDEAAAFHLGLAPAYADCPERNAHINYPESAHMMREADFEQAFARLLQWFDRFLAQAGGAPV